MKRLMLVGNSSRLDAHSRSRAIIGRPTGFYRCAFNPVDQCGYRIGGIAGLRLAAQNLIGQGANCQVA